MEASTSELFAGEVSPEASFDPLHLASQAIKKLREYGLPTHIQASDVPVPELEGGVVLELPSPVETVSDREAEAEARLLVVEPKDAAVPTARRPKMYTRDTPPKSDLVRIGGNLYKPADVLRMEDEAALKHQTNLAAVRCQVLLHQSQTAELSVADQKEIAQAISWIEDSVRPIMLRICRTYKPNERYSRHDMMQTIREQTVTEIVPQFDISKGDFHAYFAEAAWRRVDAEVGKNMSHFRTPYHGLRLSGDAKRQALNTTSYHALQAFDSDGEGERGEYVDAMLGASEDGDPVRSLLTHEIVDCVKDAIDNFSPIEKIAFEQRILGGMGYAEIIQKNNLSGGKKEVDNATQRAKKKLAKALAVQGLTSDIE